jgi:protein-serine/threonine kinase
MLTFPRTDYAAPEVLRGLPYRGKEQDVWALGILLYTIVYKENPFYSIDEIMDHDLRVPYILSEDCIDLIRKMLDRDVERRIAIQAVLEHPWTTFVDEEDEDAATKGQRDGTDQGASTEAKKSNAGQSRTDVVMREGKGQIGAEEEARAMSAAGVTGMT